MGFGFGFERNYAEKNIYNVTTFVVSSIARIKYSLMYKYSCRARYDIQCAQVNVQAFDGERVRNGRTSLFEVGGYGE